MSVEAHVRIISHPNSQRNPEPGIMAFLDTNGIQSLTFERFSFNRFDLSSVSSGCHWKRILALFDCAFGNFCLSFHRDKRSLVAQIRKLAGEIIVRIGGELIEIAFRPAAHRRRILRDLNITEVHYAATQSALQQVDSGQLTFVFEDDAEPVNPEVTFPVTLVQSSNCPIAVDLSNSFSLTELNLKNMPRRQVEPGALLEGFVTDSLCAYAYNKGGLEFLARGLAWIRNKDNLRYAPVDFALNRYLFKFRNVQEFETVRLSSAPFHQGSLRS